MLASHTQSETLQCGTSSSKLPFQKRAFSSILAFTGGCLEAEALGPVCPMAKFRKACVTGALKGRSVLLMKSRALIVSQMRTEENLAPYAAGVLQASERLREISFCTSSSTSPTPLEDGHSHCLWEDEPKRKVKGDVCILSTPILPCKVKKTEMEGGGGEAHCKRKCFLQGEIIFMIIHF